MGHRAIGVGQSPGRKGIGTIALVKNRQRGFKKRASQVPIELSQLRGVEQSLVDNGLGRKGGDVKVFDSFFTSPLTSHLACEEESSLEHLVIPPVTPRDQNLLHGWKGRKGLVSEAFWLNRHLSPADDLHVKGLNRLFQDLQCSSSLLLVFGRQEKKADSNIFFRLLPPVQERRFGFEKGLRQLNHHTGAIARLGISVQGPAMGKVA